MGSPTMEGDTYQEDNLMFDIKRHVSGGRWLTRYVIPEEWIPHRIRSGVDATINVWLVAPDHLWDINKWDAVKIRRVV